MGKSRTITTCKDWQELNRRMMQLVDEPTGVVTVEAGAEAGNVRRLTLQVRDRLGEPWAGRWLVRFYLATSENGDPDATGNTVALVAGTTLWRTVTADAAYEVLTDATGKAMVDLTIVGAATRWVHAMTDRGRMDANGPFAWA